MGSFAGTQKVAAKRIGISLEAYKQQVKEGFKWCYKCKSWQPQFLFDTDNSRGDKLYPACQTCRRVKVRVQRKNLSPSMQHRQKASDAVRYAIKKGRLAKPNSLPCFYCGKKASQYHHHHGYGDTHLLDIRATCSKCHINQHWDN